MNRSHPFAKPAAFALLAASLTLTAGCQSSDDGGTETTETDLGHLDSMLAENNRLITELVDIQGRLIRDCLEEAGHTVHDEFEFVMWDFQKNALPDVDSGALPWLIEREVIVEAQDLLGE